MSQETNYLSFTSPSGKVIKIGKPKEGYVNIFCNFNPLREKSFVSRLDNGLTIEIVNIHSYDDGTGGIAIKMLNQNTYEDVVNDVENCFQLNIA